MENNPDKLNRRQFFKSIPSYLMKGVGSAAQGALSPAAEKEPRVARIDITRCLAWGGASCQLCYLACPLRDQALEMHDQKPVIIASFCDGCAMCVTACETVNDLPAIQLVVRKQMSPILEP